MPAPPLFLTDQTDATGQIDNNPTSSDPPVKLGKTAPLFLTDSPSFGTGFVSSAAGQLPSIDGVNPQDLNALLATIREVESSNDPSAYNMLYGGDSFEGYDAHPNISKKFKTKSGTELSTTAAGAYQFLKGTWDEFAEKVGITGFSPQEQDQVAIQLLSDKGAIDALREGNYERALEIAGETWVGIGGKLAADADQHSPAFSVSLENFRQFRSGEKGLDPKDFDKFVDARIRQEDAETRISSYDPLAPDFGPSAYTRPGNVEDYADYMEYISPFQDIDKVRARNQSWTEQLGHGLGRVIPNAILGIAEGAGILLDIPAVYNTITGEDGDYSNWLTDMAQAGKEAVNEALPVYRENPSQVWNPGDFAWWVENGEGLVESIASFYVLGAGLATATSKIASGAARMAGFMAKGTQAARGVAAGATAAGLAYSEGAMEAADVYKQVLEQGITDDTPYEIAKLNAAEAAAHTVRINTIVNTGLNLTGTMAFFRPLRSQRALTQAGLARNAGETMTEWAVRLKENPATQGFMARLLHEAGREAPQEALEELVNEVSRAEGLFYGQEAMGLADNRSLGERIADTIFTPQAALAATLGSIGGAGQALVTGLAPSMKLEQGDGAKKPALYKRLEFRASRESAAIREAQVATRNALVKQIDAHVDARQRMKDAADKGDVTAYNKARNDLFNTIAEDRITSGMEEQLLIGFEEISKMTPEQAEEAGWDTRPESKFYYKKMAQERISKTKQLTNRWNELQDTYAFQDDEHLSRLPYFIFGAEVQRDSLTDQLKEVDADLASLKEVQSRMARLDGTETTYQEVLDIQKEQEALVKQREVLGKKLESIQKLMETEEGRKKLQAKYGTYDMDSIMTAIRMAVGGLERREEDLSKRGKVIEEAMTAAADGDQAKAQANLSKWLAENKSYAEAVETLQGDRAALSSDLEEISSSLKAVTARQGRKKFTDAFNAELDRLQKLQKEKVKEAIKAAPTKKVLDNIKTKIDPENNPDLADEIEKRNAELLRDEIKRERDQAREVDKLLESQGRIEEGNEEVFEVKDFVDPQERQEVLDSILGQDNYMDANDVFGMAARSFRLDAEFVKEAKAHIKRLLDAKRKTTSKNQDDATESGDKGTAPPPPPIINRYSSQDDVDDDVDPRDDTTTEKTKDGKTVVIGEKVVDGALAFAHKTKESQEVITDENGERTIMQVDIGEELSSMLIPETLDYRKLQPGDGLTIELDLGYVDPKSGETYKSLSAGEDGWMHAPMRIVYKGKTVGWVHDVNWVDRHDNGTPVNIADTEGNWTKQRQAIRKIRRYIWENKSAETVVLHHGIGHLSKSYLHDADGNIVMKNGRPVTQRRSLAENTGDDVKFVVSVNGQFREGEDPTTKKLVNKEVFPTGQPGILIPTSAADEKGKQLFIAAPIWLPTVADSSNNGAKDLFDMIRIFHSPSAAQETKDLSDATGSKFNVNADVSALHDILVNYFLSGAFKKEDLRNTEVSTSRIFFHFSQQTGHVKIARHGAAKGGGIIYTTDASLGRDGGAFRYMFETAPDGSLLHAKAIQEMMGDLFLNLDVARANGSSTMRHVGRDSEGKWTGKKVKYRDFMRAAFSTTIKGTQLEDGRWVYTEQPTILFADPTGKTKRQVATPTPQKGEGKPPESTKPQVDEEVESKVDDLSVGESVETGSNVASDLDSFLMGDDELEQQGTGRVETAADSAEARSTSPFFSYPSAVGKESLSEQLQSNGDVRLTCKV